MGVVRAPEALSLILAGILKHTRCVSLTRVLTEPEKKIYVKIVEQLI